MGNFHFNPEIPLKRIRYESLMVPLIQSPKWGDPFDPNGSVKPHETVELKPHSFAKYWGGETMDDVYTIYVPRRIPANRVYEDWEIEKMRAACKSFGVKFQLHLPPVCTRIAPGQS